MTSSEVAIATYREMLTDIGRKQAFALARDDMQEYGDLEWARGLLIVAREGERLHPDTPDYPPTPDTPTCHCIECIRWAMSEHPA